QRCEVGHIPASELTKADEMFVTGTMGEITPVTRLDDHAFSSVPGPVTSRVAAWYRALTTDPEQGTCMVDL
ncbi:MAG: hypothetical protein RIQ79_1540, partial [Verrucomicrobiota bacterium]